MLNAIAEFVAESDAMISSRFRECTDAQLADVLHRDSDAELHRKLADYFYVREVLRRAGRLGTDDLFPASPTVGSVTVKIVE